MLKIAVFQFRLNSPYFLGMATVRSDAEALRVRDVYAREYGGEVSVYELREPPQHDRWIEPEDE